MRSVVLASLRIHTRRYVAAALAVVIGVAFVVSIAALSSATRDGLTRGVSAPFAAADVVATGLSGADAATVVAAAERSGAAAGVLGWAAETVALDGRVLGDLDAIGHVATGSSADLRWQELVEGDLPTQAGEALVEASVAERLRLAIGDTLTIGQEARTVDVRVVGLVDAPSTLAVAQVYLTWADLAAYADNLYVDSIAWAGPTEPLAAALSGPTAGGSGDGTGIEIVSTDEHVAELTAEINRGVDVIAVLLLIFASIALFVSVLVIANTFSILFAQRRRDFALLRCVGATRRQVLRSVRLEALVLGGAASLLGLGVGTAAGRGIVALVDGRFPEADLGEASISPAWYAGAAATGLLVTVVASWLPTRGATRIEPLAALRPEADVDVRSAAGRVRIAVGTLVVLGGVALLALSVVASSPPVMVAGGTATFTGILLLGPLLVPALVSTAGRLAGRVLGTPGRLATANAVRHPRRTATTAASLLIGVTLTTAVLTGMASARGAVDTEMDRDNPLDATITATADAPLPPRAVDGVRAVEGVADVLVVPGTTAEAGRLGTVPVVGLPDDRDVVVRGDGASLAVADDEVLVPYGLVPERGVPERVSVTVGGRTERLRVELGGGWGDALLVSGPTLDRLAPAATPAALWVRADDGADVDKLTDGLELVAASYGATSAGGATERAYIDLQLDIVTGAVVGLLAIAVVIALIGIANTLGLSVLERAREHALLRALGLTKRQLRAMLATEAVLLSVVATALGTVIGVSFAWVGVQAMVRAVVEEAPMVFPVGQLAGVVAVSAVAGLLACVVPARRAGAVSPAAGLALD